MLERLARYGIYSTRTLHRVSYRGEVTIVVRGNCPQQRDLEALAHMPRVQASVQWWDAERKPKNVVTETADSCKADFLGCDREIFREWATANPMAEHLLKDDWQKEPQVHAGTKGKPSQSPRAQRKMGASPQLTPALDCLIFRELVEFRPIGWGVTVPIPMRIDGTEEKRSRFAGIISTAASENS